MRITMNLYYTGQKRQRAQNLPRRWSKAAPPPKIRAEAGNLRYELFFPDERPRGPFLLIDSWSDQAALDAHHASPMMGAIAALAGKIRPAYAGGALSLRRRRDAGRR